MNPRIFSASLFFGLLLLAPALADPGDDTCDFATPAGLPYSQPMNVQPLGDHNWVVFTVPGPEAVTVRIETLTDLPGSGTDNTDLTLWRDCVAGVPVDELAFNDDSPLANDIFMSRIDTFCLEPGDYYVEVGGGFDFDAADNITLEIEIVDICLEEEPGCAELELATAPCEGQCSGGGNHCGGAVTGGRSVYLFSGEFYEYVEDLRIKGRGPDFVWTRKYRSRLGRSSAMGTNWDHGYNIKITPVEVQPGEVQDLLFLDKENFHWQAPANTGGPPAGLVYCSLRSSAPDGFHDGGLTTIIDPDGPDLMTNDPFVPAAGLVSFYLVSAKNGFREGSLGKNSTGVERQGIGCGVRGPDLILEDGNSRRDLYSMQPGGTQQAPEFFREFSCDPEGNHVLHFGDMGKWVFQPFDGSPHEGKITAIVDRNGNALTFAYNVLGELDTITDTLGRQILVAYNANGLIESVTDFAGRQVKYTYYDDPHPDGSFADLKSVTTPAVSGTPNGNDYPMGKTTVYTYSENFADPRLNHNLLTITDPKGQTYLINEYAATMDPSDPLFDRLVGQDWGEPGDRIDFVRVPVVQEPGKPAVLKVIENDRNGNVDETHFDPRNRNVAQKELTGRANPDQPTTPTVNRPGPPLRPGDPSSFDWFWEYDGDSLPTRTVRPNGDEIQTTYDPSNPDRRGQGNLQQLCRFPGVLGGDQTAICELYEFDPAFNLVTRYEDGRGNETVHVYDGEGNQLQTTHRIPSIVENFEYNAFGQMTAHILPDNGSAHRRRDEYTYYVAGPQQGYLESTIVDAGGFEMTTTYEYDLVGNVVRTVDPRGADTLLDVNPLDQVVRTRSRQVDGVRYETRNWYDPNDNVVRVEIENRDDLGILDPNEELTTVYEYDILNYMFRVCTEDGTYTGSIPGTPEVPECTGLPQSEFVVEEFEYDANRNQTLHRFGEAVNGGQPANTLDRIYDERDLVLDRIEADGDSSQSTTRYDYDGNTNLIREHQGTEGTPRVTEYAYDGYDRITRVTDPMGNETERHYDANGNRVSELVTGELVDVPGDTSNVRLWEVEYQYDPMDRRTRIIAEHFDSDTQAPIGDGQAETIFEYNDNSQKVKIIDDNSHEYLGTYDTANRPLMLTDPKDNTRLYLYDDNSNVTSKTETEKSDLGDPDQVFVTTYAYDGLDRIIRTTDNVGNRHEYRYDSRDNQTLEEDAQRTAPANPGNITTYEYDGMNRLIREVRLLTSDGTGSGSPAGSIETRLDWDDSSRLIEEEDDSGNVTTYAYDPLDRRILTTYADGTQEQRSYDVHDNNTTTVDPNGTTITSVYDLLDRETGRTINRAAGILGTTSESFAYDGLSRLIEATDDDSSVFHSHDSLSNIIGETQDSALVTGQTILCEFDGVGNKLTAAYPGGRVLTYTYDALDRISSIADGGLFFAAYRYIGPERVELKFYGNETGTIYTYDGIANAPGDFGLKQLVHVTHEGGVSPFDERTYTWDRMQNKSSRTITAGKGGFTETYEYDSVYRLVNAIESSPGPSGGSTSYTYDDVGNRVSVSGGFNPGSYTMDGTSPVPADLQLNQYTTSPGESRLYDENGNHEGDGVDRIVAYDYQGRMVSYQDVPGGINATYQYDALGRRILQDSTSITQRYFYDGWQVVEEQSELGALQASYVYGLYIDEVLNVNIFGDNYYYHEDALYSVVAITDFLGNVVEGFEYDEFGRPTDPFGDPLFFSLINNSYLFSGRRYDYDTGLYYYRYRYLDPRIGRFTTRDPIGMWGDAANLGNGYSLAGNNPTTRLDPMGLHWRQHKTKRHYYWVPPPKKPGWWDRNGPQMFQKWDRKNKRYYWVLDMPLSTWETGKKKNSGGSLPVGPLPQSPSGDGLTHKTTGGKNKGKKSKPMPHGITAPAPGKGNPDGPAPVAGPTQKVEDADPTVSPGTQPYPYKTKQDKPHPGSGPTQPTIPIPATPAGDTTTGDTKAGDTTQPQPAPKKPDDGLSYWPRPDDPRWNPSTPYSPGGGWLTGGSFDPLAPVPTKPRKRTTLGTNLSGKKKNGGK